MDPSVILKKYLKRPPKPFNSIIENGDKEDYFEGSNLDKPEKLTPMEMELRIQADRVMFALNKATAVLSVLANIQLLLEDDAKLIRQNFTQQEVAYIMYVLKSYDSDSTTEETSFSGELYRTVNDIKLGNVVKSKGRSAGASDQSVDVNLSQVIHMIFTNKCIRRELSNAKGAKGIPYILQFIRDFEELKAVAKLKLYVTGTEEEARDKQLRQAYKSNVMLTAAMADLQLQLGHQREQLGNELSKKVEVFDRYNSKIEGIKEDFQISIEKNIHESEKKMMHQCLESEEKQVQLSVEAEAITKQFENLLTDHLEEEKKLRAKRIKTETQLQNWLTKYDQDIGEKQMEYEALKKEYDDEKEAMDDLEEKMDEQERQYNTLMAEKEEEEERLYQEIAYKLLVNRSARIIQRAWRAYRERRSKRRGKKGKKGKDAKKKKPKTLISRKDDPSAILEGKFKGDVFKEMKNPDGA